MVPIELIFLLILVLYALVACAASIITAKRYPRRLPWVLLVTIGFAIGGLLAMLLGSNAIALGGGGHAIYCPDLPAAHFLSCMPTFSGVWLAAFIASSVAATIIATGAVLMGVSRLLRKRR